MIRRTVSAQRHRPDVDPLEERKLLSTFDGFNSSRFIGPLPFQQAPPVVITVDYAPPYAGGDPGAGVMISRGDWSPPPGPRNLGSGSGPFNPAYGSGSLDPGQGMMPPPPGVGPGSGLDHNNSPLPPRMQAFFDWIHGQTQADGSLSETLRSVNSSGSTQGMNHSESLPPPDSYTPGMGYSANSNARNDFAGGAFPHGPGPASSFDNSEFMNAVSAPSISRPGVLFNGMRIELNGSTSHGPQPQSEVQDVYSGMAASGNPNFNATGFPHNSVRAEAAAALAVAGMESNATANMARNGDPVVSHAMVGPTTASITPSMPRTALTMSQPFIEQSMSISSATSADLASSSLPHRNSLSALESESRGDRVTDQVSIDPPLEFEASVGVIAARGTELLSQFLPGDVTLLGNAVDKFLERLHGLGDSLQTPEDSAPARIQWPIAVTLGAVILEIGRRRFLKREDDDESAGSGFAPGSRLAGWPGSWTARVP